MEAQGHSANVLKSLYLPKYWSYGVDFDRSTNAINLVKQNVAIVTMTFNFSGQGHHTQFDTELF